MILLRHQFPSVEALKGCGCSSLLSCSKETERTTPTHSQKPGGAATFLTVLSASCEMSGPPLLLSPRSQSLWFQTAVSELPVLGQQQQAQWIGALQHIFVFFEEKLVYNLHQFQMMLVHTR